MVAEVDVARDGAGRWRHAVRLVHIRTDLAPTDVPLFASL
ncbi:ATP-dependent DNA ligase [Streptomyces sp. NBC_01352]|nr:ATP-dependent DNA ligase [Streptomyces sp. NBC_01352]